MAEQPFGLAAGPRAVIPPGTTELSVSDQTRRIDRCLQILAHRRRRYSLYHLQRANSGLSIGDLARTVEDSVTPSGSSLTEMVLEEATLRFTNNHLPKLEDAGLVVVTDGHVELASNPPMPIQDWLDATASAELESAHPPAPMSVAPGVTLPENLEDLPQY